MGDPTMHVPGKNAGHIMFYGLSTCGWCAKTKKLLDEMGLDKKDSEGFRLMPNGEKLTVEIGHTGEIAAWASAAELVKEYWDDVGVRTTVKTFR